MLDQIRDVFRNRTLADLAGDFIGAACILAIPAIALFIGWIYQ